MGNVFDEYPGAERKQGWWEEPLIWAGLVISGWLVAEITAMPALGAALACAKFGWKDFLTARWLRRIDPHLGRGRACFWLYVAWGLGKVSAVSPLFMTGILLIHGFQNPQAKGGGGDAKFDACFGFFATGLLGVNLMGATGSVALRQAYRSQVKLWLSPEIHTARSHNVWPSAIDVCNRKNRAQSFLAISMMAAVWALAWAALYVPALLHFAVRGLVPPPDFLVLGGLAWLPIPGAVQGLLVPILPHVATEPAECWGPEPTERDPFAEERDPE